MTDRVERAAASTDQSPSARSGLQAAPPTDWHLGFWSLIVTQFQNAFNDNAIKFLVIFIVVAMNFSADKRDFLVLVVGALFAVPFLLFSLTGGYFADRHSKRSVVIGTKLMEVGVMVVTITGLAARNIWLECAGVFLISSQSALFGPSKYGLLPELLPEERLSWGNGVLELGTFLGSISAVIASGYLAERFAGRQAWSGVVLLGCTAMGLATSFGISRVPAADARRKFRWNPLGELGDQLRIVRADKVLTWAVMGNTYLWFLAALLQFTIVVYGQEVLHLDSFHTSLLEAAVGIGIGVGSFAAGYLSGGKIEYGLVPLGAVGMTVFGALLYLRGQTVLSTSIHLSLLGFFGGFFAVPLNALIQHRPRPEEKGGVIAAANLLSFVGIFLAAGFYYAAASGLHQSMRGIFLDGAALTLLTTIYAVYLLPDSMVRLALWLLTHTLYEIRVVGRENIPERGGALFVANHMSLLDSLLLTASTDRTIQFLILKEIYDLTYIKPFARWIRGIPISLQQPPQQMIHVWREAANIIRSGGVLCLFAEGQITQTGRVNLFRNGMENVMKDVDAPIVAVSLDGVWGSIFSHERGRFVWKPPRRIPCPVTVNFGRPMPPTAKPFEVREAVQKLQTEAFQYRRKKLKTLGQSLIHAAHHSPWQFAMGDARRPRMKWGAVLLSSIFLARRLKQVWEDQERVGILLPSSVPGALVNFAATLSGKVPVNLNYTASNEVLASCAEQCNLKTVITTKALLDKIPLHVPGKTILLEDAAAKPDLAERIAALAIWFLPGRRIERKLSGGKWKSLDDVAAIIFSSGSTGNPKGVMLTNYNIVANIEQMDQRFLLNQGDVLLGVLPFSHSFGFTVTLWLPAVAGVGVAYHPSPLDSGSVASIVSDYRVTFLLSTPIFLQHYIRKIPPEDFKSLQFVVVGAEKLTESVAMAFEDRFGIMPLEVYGCTECSPVVAMNTRDFQALGFRQGGEKWGRIGHPLPGVSVRIVDPQTWERRGVNVEGLMLVRGPNVMLGYLGSPEKTAEVLRNGWYVTGDIATEDEDGFLTITDRLTRFSKIGGEMVPHIKVEEKLQDLLGEAERKFVVTGVPNAKKGERLIVLHTLKPEELARVLQHLGETGLPNLWAPRATQFHRIEEMPYLGTGKLDLRRVQQIALEISKKQEDAATKEKAEEAEEEKA